MLRRASAAGDVAHQHKGTAGATQHVGEGALEEGLEALCPVDLAPCVHGASVHDVRGLAAGLRHARSTLHILYKTRGRHWAVQVPPIERHMLPCYLSTTLASMRQSRLDDGLYRQCKR